MHPRLERVHRLVHIDLSSSLYTGPGFYGGPGIRPNSGHPRMGSDRPARCRGHATIDPIGDDGRRPDSGTTPHRCREKEAEAAMDHDKLGVHIPVDRADPVVKGSGKDPWTKLANQARNGDLEFEPYAALDAANGCADAIRRITGLQAKIDDMDNLQALSQLPSGRDLAVQFNKTRDGLRDVLGSHKNRLATMMETFKDAGRQYVNSEWDSAAGFSKANRDDMLGSLNKVTVGNKAPNFDTDAPTEKETKISKADGKDEVDATIASGRRNFTDLTADSPDKQTNPAFGRAGGKAADLLGPASQLYGASNFPGRAQTPSDYLTSVTNSKLGVTPSPENPYSQLWADLHKLGLRTGAAVDPVGHTAKMWEWMAGELDGATGELTSRLVDRPRGAWKGAGADDAKKAVRSYGTKADDLHKQMKAFSETLADTAGWLAKTKKHMPPTEKPPKPAAYGYDIDSLPVEAQPMAPPAVNAKEVNDAQNERDLETYRQNMENLYIDGIHNSSTRIPALEDLPTTGSKNKGGSDNPGGGADTPTGGGTGPSAPGAGAPNYSTTGLTGGGIAPSASPGSNLQAGYDRPAAPSVGAGPTVPSATDPTSPTDPTAPTAPGADGLGQAAGMAQQGLDGAQSAAQQAAQAAQQAAQQAAGIAPGLGGLPKPGDLPRANTSGLGGAPRTGGGIGAGQSSAAAQAPLKGPDTSRLFPRASIAGPAAAPSLGRMGAPMAGMPGSPGPAGAGAGNQGGQEKDHKRATYLNSKEHLEEALGEPQTTSKAVVEQ
ncbi:hypothetical protein [Nocardia sp. NPDC019395]|uniref:hypothetical protein n=1 Tax=Nocardia sp. NPDC019395 TaxID=3154686 RepID=UPI0033EA550C